MPTRYGRDLTKAQYDYEELVNGSYSPSSSTPLSSITAIRGIQGVELEKGKIKVFGSGKVISESEAKGVVSRLYKDNLKERKAHPESALKLVGTENRKTLRIVLDRNKATLGDFQEALDIAHSHAQYLSYNNRTSTIHIPAELKDIVLREMKDQRIPILKTTVYTEKVRRYKS